MLLPDVRSRGYQEFLQRPARFGTRWLYEHPTLKGSYSGEKRHGAQTALSSPLVPRAIERVSIAARFPKSNCALERRPPVNDTVHVSRSRCMPLCGYREASHGSTGERQACTFCCCQTGPSVKRRFCMPSRKRQGNNPKRRIAPLGTLTCDTQLRLARAQYVGSAHHKSQPGDYGFSPPVNPRPTKSLCDDVRLIDKREAIELFRSGIRLGMVSSHLESGLPKYVWAVDRHGNAYEAKLGGGGSDYHGYRLRRDDRMQAFVLAEWRERNQHDDNRLAD